MLWLSVWRSASSDDSMEAGSERQKMQCKKSEVEETRGGGPIVNLDRVYYM